MSWHLATWRRSAPKGQEASTPIVRIGNNCDVVIASLGATPDECNAIARKITATPDLLAFAHEFEKVAIELNRLAALCRAAIAKAEGQTL